MNYSEELLKQSHRILFTIVSHLKYETPWHDVVQRRLISQWIQNGSRNSLFSYLPLVIHVSEQSSIPGLLPLNPLVLDLL